MCVVVRGHLTSGRREADFAAMPERPSLTLIFLNCYFPPSYFLSVSEKKEKETKERASYSETSKGFGEATQPLEVYFLKRSNSSSKVSQEHEVTGCSCRPEHQGSEYCRGFITFAFPSKYGL